MSPKDYYNSLFRKHILEFLSHIRPHNHGDDIHIINKQLSKDNLTFLDPKHHQDFLISLAFTVLIDQVMYTYFKTDYQKFRNMTMYPKLELGITNIHATPWSIISKDTSGEKFKEYVSFFINDFESFFDQNTFQFVTWEKMKEKMLFDKDVAWSYYGEIFVNVLESE